MDTKKDLRKKARMTAENLSLKKLKDGDRIIFDKLMSCETITDARCVFCYVSTEYEPDTKMIIEYFLTKKIRVAVPKCDDVTLTMTAHEIRSTDELKVGLYGIKEPPKNATIVCAREFDVIIMPCVATDKNGNRLGHGKGYYDKFLQEISSESVTICLCRSALVFDQIPNDTHDIKPKIILVDS